MTTSAEGNPDNQAHGWSAQGQPPNPHDQAPYYYPGYPPPYPPPYRPTNGLAIASLVLGILWIYWIGSILALIFGYVARKQIRERGEGGGGLATAGIVLGWIGLSILVAIVVIGFILGITRAFETVDEGLFVP